MGNLLALNKSRAMMQRRSDAKFFTGWVKQISSDVATVYTCTDVKIQVGDEFSFQVFGNGKRALFQGKATVVRGVDPGPLFSPSE